MARRLIIGLVCMAMALQLGLSAAMANPVAGKKVLYIDSYHEGYAWSDGILKGIKQALDGKGTTLKVVYMDTKRNADVAFAAQAGQKVKAEIEAFKPDVVIAADDNASRHVVMAFYKNAALPFVFCGVNWDATVYGYPYTNATGMIEVTPVNQLIDQLQKVAKGKRIGFLAPEVETARKEFENYQKVFKMDPLGYFAKDYEDWKKGFTELQGKTDIVIIDSDGGLYKANEADMKAFVAANTKIPTGSCYDFMAPYAILSFAKIAEEQGVWSANAALKILGGTAPKDIPITPNKEGTLIFNAKLAKAAGIQMPFDVISSAQQVIE